MKKLKNTTESIIKDFKLKHGDTYDYSKVVYENLQSKVLIICPIHGEFHQSPGNHRKGQGCPICGLEKWKKSRTKSQEKIINDFRQVHGSKYDYSKVIYKNSRSHVIVICPIHGEFKVTPNTHLAGKNCWDCAKDHNTENKIIELTGKKIGKLTVLNRVKDDNNTLNYGISWLVQCSCGRDPYVVSSGSLLSKKNVGMCKVCANREAEKTRKRNRDPLIGRKFGLLTVIREWGTKTDGGLCVICNCDCGGQAIYRWSQLRNGDNISCGCRQKKGWDTLHNLLTNENQYALDEACKYYIFSIPKLDNWFKIGIAKDIKKRISGNKSMYGEFIASWDLSSRRVAICIETAVLRDDGFTQPFLNPELFHLEEVQGFTEIRGGNIELLTKHIEHLINTLESGTENWSQWALDHIPNLREWEKDILISNVKEKNLEP